MESVEARFKLLKIRENELSYLKNMAFDNIEDAIAFFNENSQLFEELKEVRQEIDKLEWSTKNTEEKKVERIALIGLVEKFLNEQNNEQKKEYMEAYVQLVDLIIQIKRNGLIDIEIREEFTRFLEKLQGEKFWGLGSKI